MEGDWKDIRAEQCDIFHYIPVWNYQNKEKIQGQFVTNGMKEIHR